jgi:hypothetical protein
LQVKFTRKKNIIFYNSHFNLLFYFHSSAAQFFGNLPVHGVLTNDPNELKFKWISPRVFYTLFYLIIGSVEVGTMLYRAFLKGFNILVAGKKKEKV